jgi:hypothetical protein
VLAITSTSLLFLLSFPNLWQSDPFNCSRRYGVDDSESFSDSDEPGWSGANRARVKMCVAMVPVMEWKVCMVSSMKWKVRMVRMMGMISMMEMSSMCVVL